jgi:hypothetical protein
MSHATPEQLAQTRSDILWLVSAGVVKNNGDNTYSLTKEARDLIEQLISSEKVLEVCVITVLKISKGFLEDVVLVRYARIVKLLYEGDQRKETKGK